MQLLNISCCGNLQLLNYFHCHFITYFVIVMNQNSNICDLLGKLGMSGDGNMRNGIGGRIEAENNERDVLMKVILESGRNPVQGKLP